MALYPVEGEGEIRSFAERIIQQITDIGKLYPGSESFGASVGAIYGIPPKNTASKNLLELSDTLMYQVKTSGKGSYKIMPM